MTILQINEVCGRGSTGTTTLSIGQALEEQGHESYVAYGHGTCSHPNSFKIGYNWEDKLHALLFTRILGLHGFGSYFGTKRLLRKMEEIRPDIIHLRNLHCNYLNYPLLYRYIIKHQIPVVMTLHDCYNFTGQCEHYVVAGCERWKTECHNCPLRGKTIAQSWLLDNSRYLYNKKKKWYSQIKKMAIFGVSGWLKGEASQSILAGNGHIVDYIYNWIDTDVFRPASEDEKTATMQKYGLSADCKYIVAVGAGWSNATTRYEDAVKLAESLPEGYKLLVVGGLSGDTTFPDMIKHIGYTESPKELAAIYSVAEAYVHFSLADTFGKVIAEAMACGATPIVYDTTACPEVTGGLGFVVGVRDIPAMVECIRKIDNSADHRDALAQYVKDNYSKDVNIQKYIDIYKELSKNKRL